MKGVLEWSNIYWIHLVAGAAQILLTELLVDFIRLYSTWLVHARRRVNQAWRTHKIEGVAIAAAMAPEGQCIPAFGRNSRQFCPYVFLDAFYEKGRQDGQIRGAAILNAVSVDLDGKRQIPGVSASLSEHEIHWRTFLQSLVVRGLNSVRASPAITMPV